MHSRIQKSKLSREGKFLNMYSRWQETKDDTLRNRLFMSMDRLMKKNPGFDFRRKLWQAV